MYAKASVRGTMAACGCGSLGYALISFSYYPAELCVLSLAQGKLSTLKRTSAQVPNSTCQYTSPDLCQINLQQYDTSPRYRYMQARSCVSKCSINLDASVRRFLLLDPLLTGTLLAAL